MKTKNQLCNLYLIAEEAAYSAKVTSKVLIGLN